MDTSKDADHPKDCVVALREITAETVREICELDVAPPQPINHAKANGIGRMATCVSRRTHSIKHAVRVFQ